MSKLQKSDLTSLFGLFLDEFYNGQPIYKDTLLTKTMILPKQSGSTNEFLHDTGDFIFKKANKCSHDIVNNGLTKSSDFFRAYCDMVRLIKVKDEFENFFESEEYKNLSKEIKEWEAIYGKALFDLIENQNEARGNLVKMLKSEGKKEDEINDAINDFLSHYRDPKNAGIMEDASRNIKAKKIAMELMIDQAGVSRPAMMVYDARLMCNEAERHDAKNMFNMLVEGASFGGYFEPMIRSNSATLKTIGSSLELSKAAKYRNNKDDSSIETQISGSSKEIAKYMEQTKLPAGSVPVSEQEKQKELVTKQEECAKKGYVGKGVWWSYPKSQRDCELELEKAEKLYYATKHDKEYEELKRESEERRSKNLKKFEKFSENEKLEQCKEANYVKYFSENSLKSLAAKGSVSGNYMFVGGQASISYDETKQKTDASCISFQGLHAIPLRYPWLHKDLYNLDFSNKEHGVFLDVKDFKYEHYKDFLLDRCIIPKSVIVGAGMRAHFKKDLLEVLNFDSKISVEANQLLWSVKAESQNGYSNYDQKTGSFDIYEPDLLTVLGYELEDLCPSATSHYFQSQCYTTEL